MRCPQCQHENREGAKFCDACGTRCVHDCPHCGHEGRPQANFCEACGTPLLASSAATSPGQADTDMRFHALLPDIMARLQRDGRVTYHTLKYVFAIDDAFLEQVRQELTFKQLARDEQGEGLVWLGAPPSVVPPTPTGQPQPTVPDLAVAPAPPVSSPIPEPTAAASTPPEPRALPAAPHPPEAERRQLTVMFCDLADSTKLSQHLDPEDLRDVVRAYQATAAAVVHQYDGHLAQYLGDGLLIYFGWPVAHEDDAHRALHAGLGIVEALTTHLNPRLEHENGVRLKVRLGIHTGPVVVGEMGGGGRHEQLATGETVNIAARLEGLAQPNTVVMSSVTARLVERSFALEDLGLHTLKGVAEPMHVFRVRGLREGHDDDARVVAGTPFLVGRDEEVGLLLRRWEQSKAGLGQVVLISGEAGIGKSALVATVRHHVVEAGYTRVTFRCSPYHTNSALYPVIEHVQRMLHWQPGDAPATRLDTLERVLKSYSRPVEEVVPLVAALLSVPVPEERYAALHLPPQQQRQQTHDALVGWLLEEAERHPTLAIWEDLQWADPSTLEMLGVVLEQTPTVPMLHVLTFRPEFTPCWPPRSHLTPITLNRLERPQVEALITHLPRSKALPSEVVEHIVTKTDGVPLYVEELTKTLLESALLREEAEQYVLTGPLSTVAIPETLQDSLMARLDQLDTAKEVAQLGAVLGREFAYALMQGLSSQDEATLQAGLTQLVEAELLYQRGRPPHARYMFKHALIRDAAYASLLRSTRQQVHAQVAQLLEARFPEVRETQPELVAHHYTEAGCDEQAIRYWHQAGQHASVRSAYVEAIAQLTKGLDVLHRLPETSTRVRSELQLQLTLGPAIMARKGTGASELEDIYTRARTLCHQLGEMSQLFPVLWGLWRGYFARGACVTAHDVSHQMLTLAEQLHDLTLLRIAHAARGQILFFMGDFCLARSHLEQGVALVDEERSHEIVGQYGYSPHVQCLVFLSRTLWSLGYPHQALRCCQEARTLSQALNHPPSMALSLWYAAALSQHRRDTQTADVLAEALMTLATEHSFAQWLAMGSFLRGWVLAEQGHRETGLVQMHQGLSDVMDTGGRAARPHFLTLLAEAYGKNRQIDQGLSVLADALEAMQASGRRDLETEAYRLKGVLLLQQQTPDMSQAEACLHQALDIARTQHAKSLELRAATSLARLWQAQGKRQEAYDLLAPVYEWFTEGFDTADLQGTKVLLEELGE